MQSRIFLPDGSGSYGGVFPHVNAERSPEPGRAGSPLHAEEAARARVTPSNKRHSDRIELSPPSEGRGEKRRHGKRQF